MSSTETKKRRKASIQLTKDDVESFLDSSSYDQLEEEEIDEPKEIPLNRPKLRIIRRGRQPPDSDTVVKENVQATSTPVSTCSSPSNQTEPLSNQKEPPSNQEEPLSNQEEPLSNQKESRESHNPTAESCQTSLDTMAQGAKKDSVCSPEGHEEHTLPERPSVPDGGLNGISATATSVCVEKSAFANLFKNPIGISADPFQVQAAKGESGFLQSVPQSSNASQENDDVPAEEPEEPAPQVDNGEETEVALFEESRVALKKFLKRDASEVPTWGGAALGRLRLLAPKEGAGTRPRVILRSIGTNAVMLNSCLHLSGKWDKLDTATRSGVTFTAIDQEKKDATGEDLLVPHCVLFHLPERRNEFLSQVAAALHPPSDT